jgi:hypothetical protein
MELDHITRELKQLPAPRAPQSLLPRVMAAVALEERKPWYARPWMTWPPLAQAASVVLVGGLAAGVWSLWPNLPQLAAGSGSPMAVATVSWITDVVNRATQVSTVVRALWQVLLGPIAIIVVGLTVIVSLACAAAWTAVRRTALGGASS